MFLNLCYFALFFSSLVLGDEKPTEPAPVPVAKTCFHCSSTDDGDGIPTSAECLSEISQERNCTSEGHCYVRITLEGRLLRGCIGDKIVADPKICESDKSRCLPCLDKLFCNNLEVPIESCFQADYNTSDPISPSEFVSKNCPLDTFEPAGCYHMEKDGRILKGCMSSLTPKQRKEYIESPYCERCIGQNCNRKIVRQFFCHHCDGQTHTNCADEVGQSIDCSLVSTSCVVGIQKDGYTHRGCNTRNETENTEMFPNGFDICKENSCNNQTYPNDRRKCYQCKGDPICDFKSEDFKEKLQPTVCEIHAEKDECFTYFGENGKAFRGCWSDTSESRQLCEKNDESCKRCGEHGCNTHKSGSNISTNLSVGLLVSIILATSIRHGL